MQKYIDEFIEKGFVILPNVFSSEEIFILKEKLDYLRDEVNLNPENYHTRYNVKSENLTETWGVNHIFSKPLYQEEFAKIFENEKLMLFIKNVLGDELRFWGGHALWSPESTDYSLNWHRDFGEQNFYKEDGTSTHVQFNIPLVEDDCFIAIPYSHRRRLNEDELVQLEKRGTQKLAGQIQITCKPGDVLLMNAHTFHRGECSYKKIRRTLHFNLQPKEEQFGGHGSWSFMREDGYLKNLRPAIKELMENAISWDNQNQLSLHEEVKRKRIARKNKNPLKSYKK